MEWLSKILAWIFKSRCVLKEVCTEIQIKNSQTHNHLEDCIEGAMAGCSERYAELKADTHREFDELKKTMRLGFDDLKELIKDKM